MKIGIVHITISDPFSEQYLVFKTSKRLFNWVGWKIKQINSSKYKFNKGLQTSWRISKIPGGRRYENVGVVIVAKKTMFYKKPIPN